MFSESVILDKNLESEKRRLRREQDATFMDFYKLKQSRNLLSSKGEKLIEKEFSPKRTPKKVVERKKPSYEYEYRPRQNDQFLNGVASLLDRDKPARSKRSSLKSSNKPPSYGSRKKKVSFAQNQADVNLSFDLDDEDDDTNLDFLDDDDGEKDYRELFP